MSSGEADFGPIEERPPEVSLMIDPIGSYREADPSTSK